LKKYKYEIKISGVGGQGIRTAGKILGLAATIDHKFASVWTSYGVETRGGPSTCDIIIASQSIEFPRVISADVLAVLDQNMLKDFLADLKPGGILIIDSDLVEDTPMRKDIIIDQLQLNRTAETLGQRLYTGMILCGALIAMTGIISKEAMLKAIPMELSADAQKVNIQAFKKGLKLADNVKVKKIR
jgi:2-oxoglutarate ferredoxin oxidoreductase subunit gamma